MSISPFCEIVKKPLIIHLFHINADRTFSLRNRGGGSFFFDPPGWLKNRLLNIVDLLHQGVHNFLDKVFVRVQEVSKFSILNNLISLPDPIFWIISTFFSVFYYLSFGHCFQGRLSILVLEIIINFWIGRFFTHEFSFAYSFFILLFEILDFLQ